MMIFFVFEMNWVAICVCPSPSSRHRRGERGSTSAWGNGDWFIRVISYLVIRAVRGSPPRLRCRSRCHDDVGIAHPSMVMVVPCHRPNCLTATDLRHSGSDKMGNLTRLLDDVNATFPTYRAGQACDLGELASGLMHHPQKPNSQG